MKLDCTEMMAILDAGRRCEPTDQGLKIATGCLYPSADPVFVHVLSWGSDGYRVTDGGGLSRTVFVHGRDESALQSGLTEASNRHSLRVEGGMLIADVPSRDWLPAAIAAVANGASLAASVAIEHVGRRAERTLANKIYESLEHVVPPQNIAKDFEYRGKSGKSWRIDYAVVRKSDKPLLVKAVTPHHTSISSNYTVFGDIGSDETERLCVYQRQLHRDDTALLRQVAALVPIGSLEVGVRDALQRRH
jgi:hypothetical protein